MRGLLVIIFFAVVTLIRAEVVSFHPCRYPDHNTKSNCTVHKVRINPCKEAIHDMPCRIRRGKNASIEFDYTADFEGENLKARAYWANSLIDLPFLGMDTNACAYTTCPATPGTKQTYTFELPILKTYPARAYDVKWKLWNAQEQECCFVVQIKLLK